MQINKDSALHSFMSYVKLYNDQNPKVQLKITHTLRVCSLCEEIALASGFSLEDATLAWLCGLLHDIGRFEQIRRYNTFSDANSVDHALLSSEILFTEGNIRNFIADDSEDTLLQKAISLHSVYRLPENLTEREKRFCTLLRDADKIDILKVNVDFALEDIYNVTSEQLYNAGVTPAVFNAFKEHHAVLRSLKKTPVDHVIGHISLIFELEYPKSLEIVASQGYLEKLCNFQSQNDQTNAVFEEIRTEIKDYMNTNIQG